MIHGYFVGDAGPPERACQGFTLRPERCREHPPGLLHRLEPPPAVQHVHLEPPAQEGPVPMAPLDELATMRLVRQQQRGVVPAVVMNCNRDAARDEEPLDRAQLGGRPLRGPGQDVPETDDRVRTARREGRTTERLDGRHDCTGLLEPARPLATGRVDRDNPRARQVQEAGNGTVDLAFPVEGRAESGLELGVREARRSVGQTSRIGRPVGQPLTPPIARPETMYRCNRR